MLTENARGSKPTAALHFGYADGLRALAVFYVFTYHMMVVAPVWAHHLDLQVLIIAFDPVDMFFILSGFLLAGPFIKSYLKDGRDFPLVSGYVIARALRALPMYVIGIILISIYLCIVHRPPSVWDFVSHLLFLEGFDPKTTQTISGPLWTFAVDIQFYVTMPFLFWYLYKFTRRVPAEKRVGILFATLGAIALVSVLWRYLAFVLLSPMTWEQEIVYVHQLPGTAYVLAIGMGTRAFLETATPAVRAWIGRWSWALIAGCIAIRPLNIIIDTHFEQTGALMFHGFHLGSLILALLDFQASLVGVTILVALACAPTNPITRLLSSRPFALASEISFGFYIYHLTVVTAIAGPHPQPSWPMFFKTGALSLLILLPTCYLFFRFVESPFLRIKSTVKRTKAPAAAEWSDVQRAGATVVDTHAFPNATEQA
jgi:peptidoglycan/LPS O-acetylase OafA/YrhL